MINLDQYIVGFVGQNWITLSLFLGLLKLVSKWTDWVGDDKIHTLLSGLFSQIRGKRYPSHADRGEKLN